MENFMSKLVVLFTLFVTTLFSNQEPESFPFFALTASQYQIDFNTISNIATEKEVLVGLRYGQQTVDWRTMFTFSGQKKIQEFTLEIDKILMDDMFGYPEVRPYLGATLGYLHYENDTLEEENGFYYGAAFGFLIYLTDNIDLDISYHYKKISDMEPLKSIKGPSFGIHYFY